MARIVQETGGAFNEPDGRTIAMPNETDVVERVLTLLRQYGWEIGYKKIEAELQAARRDGAGGAAGEPEVREFFLGWMGAERGNFEEAVRHLEAARKAPLIAGWAMAGEAFVALRRKDFALTHRLLGEARDCCGDDPQLSATVCHVEGATLYHQGDRKGAEPLLLEALRLYGPGHFAAGRVLDTLGMVHTGRDDFHGARQFFERALKAKHPDDLQGLAVSHGQLGRLYLDWGRLDEAQKHFDADLEIAGRTGDELGKVLMYNWLGHLDLARGDRESAAGHIAVARRHWEDAVGWLDKAVARSREKGWTIAEGFARKDRARVALAVGDLPEAEAQVKASEELFRSARFDEGLAHVNRVSGVLLAKQKRWDDATKALRSARSHFEQHGEGAEVARTLFEVALAARDAGEPKPLVSRAMQEALAAAEKCRRAELVGRVEEELKVVDPAAHCARAYRRVRGRAVTENSVSLIDGVREMATVLFLDLQGSTEMSRFRDPGEMMMTLNQMMAELSVVLRKHDAQVIAFRGDGFLALLRGADNASRGVRAALDLLGAMKTFNAPRAILGSPPFVARIGVNSGEVFLGNVGTYDKMDFNIVGNTVNLGARLEGQAEPGMPCIGHGTWEMVQTQFRFSDASPRSEELKGLGPTQMWDVIGPA